MRSTFQAPQVSCQSLQSHFLLLKFHEQHSNPLLLIWPSISFEVYLNLLSPLVIPKLCIPSLLLSEQDYAFPSSTCLSHQLNPHCHSAFDGSTPSDSCFEI